MKYYVKSLLSTVIILSLLGVIFYWKSSFLEYDYKRLIRANKSFMLNSIQASYDVRKNQSTTCHNVLSLMRNARWVKRMTVTAREEIQQSNTELQIRKKRGLPLILHRTDRRCGGKPYFLHAPNLDLEIPALCDVTSTAPCCNHKTKWCGAGPNNCNCHRCTDYREEISAELYNWVPFDGCIFANFTTERACSLTSSRVSRLILIGDSLVRHLFNALMILFTNDKERGSLKRVQDPKVKNCRGVMQFVDGGKTACHNKTLTSIPVADETSFCQGKYNFDFALKEYHSMNEAPNILATVRRNINRERTVIAVGVGLHMDLNAETIQTQIMDPLLNIKKSNGATWPYIIWLSVHALGSVKDTNYDVPSKNDRVARFNLSMEKYLSAYGIPVFDTFSLTNGVRSIDGTHFGMGLNMVKAQLFLNFIQESL